MYKFKIFFLKHKPSVAAVIKKKNPSPVNNIFSPVFTAFQKKTTKNKTPCRPSAFGKTEKNKSKKQGHLGTQCHNMDGGTSAFCDITKGRLHPLYPLKSRTFLGRKRLLTGRETQIMGTTHNLRPPHPRPWTRIPQSKKISNCRHQISVYTIQQLQSTQTEVQTVFDDDLFAFFLVQYC